MDDCNTYPPKPECGPTPQPIPTTITSTAPAPTDPLPQSGGSETLLIIGLFSVALFLIGYILIRSFKD